MQSGVFYSLDKAAGISSQCGAVMGNDLFFPVEGLRCPVDGACMEMKPCDAGAPEGGRCTSRCLGKVSDVGADGLAPKIIQYDIVEGDLRKVARLFSDEDGRFPAAATYLIETDVPNRLNGRPLTMPVCIDEHHKRLCCVDADVAEADVLYAGTIGT